MYNDITIIGAGPAGMSAAVYAARAGCSVALIEETVPGGQIVTTNEVNNYLGFINIDATELALKMAEHVSSFGIDIKYESVKSIDVSGEIKKVFTKKNIYESKVVIIAAGVKRRMLDVEGEMKFRGRGVSYCAVCDGMFFKDKTAAVVGGGFTAIEDAMYLSNICKKVYLIHRRNEFRAEGTIIEQLKNYNNIELVMNSVVTSIDGDKKFDAIMVNNERQIELDCVFVAIGMEPSAQFITSDIHCDENNYILTDENMMTNINGVFAAGDIRKSNLKQIITAASDGAIAGTKAAKYVKE
ncbi:MAG: thioredoxin-disulfide reductase [Oscillospiraceae bacterium]|nr:thioredoxin-disulfide reductase [Oscillospiraceae bacterium]